MAAYIHHFLTLSQIDIRHIYGISWWCILRRLRIVIYYLLLIIDPFNAFSEFGGLCKTPPAQSHPDFTTNTILALQIVVPVGGMYTCKIIE